MPAKRRSDRMVQAGDNQPERVPEGRGCGLLSLIFVLIAVLAFAFAAWISVPSATPEPAATGTPAIAPPP